MTIYSKEMKITIRCVEDTIKEVMRSLGTYVRKKKLEVNVEKTKIIVFNKRKRKS
jgi:hypothetical protein